MKKKANLNGISKAWRVVPCAIFVAFFNVFTFGALESQAQYNPSYTCTLDDVSYSGNQATLEYKLTNTGFPFEPHNLNGIRWENVQSVFAPVFLDIQNLAGFLYSTQQTGSISGTNIKLYTVTLAPTINVALTGGNYTTIKFKVGTPAGNQGEVGDQQMQCRFVGGLIGSYLVPPNAWWPRITGGLIFPTTPPPPAPEPIVIDRMYVSSGANLAFDLKNLTPNTFNTIESAASLSNPTWVTEASFNVNSTNQTVTVPLGDIEAGNSFFRIRTADS